MAFRDAGLPLETRLWSRVDKTATCWDWTGHVTGGYGRIRVNGKRVQVHRLSYELCTGRKIPDGLHLDHLCRNQRCVNPDHLEPVTPKENMSRGEAPSQVAARTGVCRNGHPLSGGNIRVRANGKRECRTCMATTRRAYQDANRTRINEQKRALYASKGGA